MCADNNHCSCPCDPATPFSLDLQNVPASKVARILTSVTGAEVKVVSGGEKMVSVSMTNGTLWQAIRRLQASPGVVLAVNGETVASVEFSPTEAVAVCATNVDLPSLLDLLSKATGAVFQMPSAPGARVTLKTTGTVPDILRQISTESGVNVQLSQSCAVTPNKTFATPAGHIGQNSITIQGYTTPSTMPVGTVIGP